MNVKFTTDKGRFGYDDIEDFRINRNYLHFKHGNVGVSISLESIQYLTVK